MRNTEKPLFREMVKKARKQRGWTQTKLAEELAIDANTVSRWERGEHLPKEAEVIEKLCELFEMTPEALGLLEAKPSFYLCYAQADAQWADRLEADLQRRGIVLANEKGLPNKAEPDEALPRALRKARAVILLASPQTSCSPTIKEELDLAQRYGCPVYTLWIAGQQRKEVLPAHQAIVRAIDTFDARDTGYMTAVDALVTTLQEFSRRLFEPRNPYKGLLPFNGQDVQDFFGREPLIEKLVDQVKEILTQEGQASETARLLAVVGPSGSGKSSVVMAGLLPRLQRDELPQSKQWVYLKPIVPGAHPLEALALAFAECIPERSLTSIRDDLQDHMAQGLHLLAASIPKPPETKVVLVVDQFEELFTQTTDEHERKQFIDLLVTASRERNGPVLVILTLRADFYDRPMNYLQLGKVLEEQSKLVLPMNARELQAVIEQPAGLPGVQLTFEGNLVGDLLFEMQGQAGALPLLQFTLDQLFQQRNGSQLTLSAYREIGGVKGALARQAESIYATLPSEKHRTLARSLFLRLIDPGVTEQDTTRRRAAQEELSLPDPEQTAIIQETADAFIAARLLTTNVIAGTTTIEVSHEALIREWARLAEWLREAREDITLQQAISEDATEWIRRGKPIDRLYRGTQLTESQEWARRNVPSRDEAAFLQASVIERQHQEAAEQSRQTRELTLKRQTVNRLRSLVAALSLFLVVSIVFAFVTETDLQLNIRLRQQDDMDKRVALSHALAANADYSLSQNELDRALLLSVKAIQTANTYEARNSLRHALEQSPRINTMLRGDIRSVIDTPLAFNSDGTSLVSSSFSDIDVWDTKARTYHTWPLVTQAYGTDIISVALSRTDQTMVTSGVAGVWLWDIQTGTQLAQLAGRSTGVLPPPISFSKDGKMVAFSQCTQFSSDQCVASQIVIWNVASKQRIGSPLAVQGDVSSLALSPDHQVLAYTNGATVQLWNIATGQSIGPLASDRAKLVRRVAFSLDGMRLATSDFGDKFGGKTLQLWDVASRQPIGSPLVGHTGLVTDIAFSPNGEALASSSEDGTVRLWDVASGDPIGSPLISNPEQQESLAFSPNGKTLASAGGRGTITLWNIATNGSPISQQYNYTVGVDSTVFSPDGRTIIMGSEYGQIFLQDSKTGELTSTLDTAIYPLRQQKQQAGDDNLLSIQSLALSKDGHILAAGRLDGTIILWDMKTKKTFAQFTYTNAQFTHTQFTLKVVLSADGQTLAAMGSAQYGYHYQTTFMLWNVAKRTAIHTRSYQFQVGSLALSPDGRLLAASVCSRGQYNTDCQVEQIILWDMVTDTLIGRPLSQGEGSILDLAFSPDGNTLAWSTYAGISLWSVATGKPIGQTLSVSSEYQGSDDYDHIAFSSSGKILVSYGTNSSSFILWDVTTSEPVTSPIEEGAYLGQLNDVAFSPNGQELVSVGFAGSASAAAAVATYPSPPQGIVTLWNISLALWENQACSIANRNLTRDEWRQFVGSEPFGEVCPDLPEVSPG